MTLTEYVIKKKLLKYGLNKESYVENFYPNYCLQCAKEKTLIIFSLLNSIC
jgi:hypothetical protein